jgi:hypothetical protein
LSEEFKFQLSVKVDSAYQDLVNIRAATAEEFAHNLQQAAQMGDLIAAASAGLKGGGGLAALTQPQAAAVQAPPAAPAPAPAQAYTPAGFQNPAQPTAPYVPPSPEVQAAAAQAAQTYTPPAPAQPVPGAVGPAGAPPMCAHGVRQFRTSKPGAARAWQAWMCPTPKGTPGQCDPEWIN